MPWKLTPCPQALPRRSDAGMHEVGMEASYNLESGPMSQPLVVR